MEKNYRAGEKKLDFILFYNTVVNIFNLTKIFVCFPRLNSIILDVYTFPRRQETKTFVESVYLFDIAITPSFNVPFYVKPLKLLFHLLNM